MMFSIATYVLVSDDIVGGCGLHVGVRMCVLLDYIQVSVPVMCPLLGSFVLVQDNSFKVRITRRLFKRSSNNHLSLGN